MWQNGKIADMIELMEEREDNQREIEEFIIKQTNITQEKLDEIRIRKIDWYIKSSEVEKLGIAEVI